MSDDRDSSRVPQWLGTAAVDAARVGPFELRRAELLATGEPPADGRFDVFMDGFDTPLAANLTAIDADLETRRFMRSIAACELKLRVPLVSSFPPPGASRSAQASRGSRSPSQRARSKRGSRRSGPRRPALINAIGFLFAVAVMSVCAYYFGTTQVPVTEHPAPIRE